MLHILWMILKIILIVIGILLGLVLLALLLVLFCPVRYGAKAEKASPSFKEVRLEASVSWLFRLIRVKILFQNGNLSPDIRVFGIPVLKLLKRKGSGSSKKAPKPPKKAAAPVTGGSPEEIPLKDTPDFRDGTEIPVPDMKSGDAGPKPDILKTEPDALKTEPDVPKAEPDVSKAMTEAEKAGSPQGEMDIRVIPVKMQKKEAEQRAGVKDRFYKRLWNKIRSVWEKIIGIPRKILEAVRKIALSIRAVYDRIDWWKQFLTHPRTRAAVSLVKQKTGRVIRHVFPTKLRGKITFGSEDPSVTGTVLAILGMTIPFHKNNVMVSPVFQGENVLEGNVWLKGRIYGIVLVKAALEIYFNKDVKYVINRWKKHKEG